MTSRTAAAAAVVAGLVASATALLLAPTLMPGSYSWPSHTTSESAAQGVDGAWLARLGFVLFGLSALLLVTVRRRVWGPAGTVLHTGFGVCMLAAAAFSARSWVPGAPYDRTEDTLHSVAATAMGFAFALGVVAVLITAGGAARRRRWPLDATAVLASVLLPLGMLLLPEVAGALQRLMFVVAYAWYLTEAARSRARRSGGWPGGAV